MWSRGKQRRTRCFMPDDVMRRVTVESELVGQRTPLRVERLLLPDGTETLRDTLYHPNSVAILSLECDGDVVMIAPVPACCGLRTTGTAGGGHRR